MNKTIKLIWQTAINLGFQFNETDAHEMYLAIGKQEIIERIRVCESCHAAGGTIDCICSYTTHKTIELEFEVCKCCGTPDDDIADTEFNEKQLNKHNELER